jgi:hypothetical protein
MKPIPGTLQEGGASFQTTHWTLIPSAQKSEQNKLSQQALSDFAMRIGRRAILSCDDRDFVFTRESKKDSNETAAPEEFTR